MMEDFAKQAQQILGNIVPGSVVIRKPTQTISKQNDLIVDIQITEEEYDQMGRPGINDTAQLDINTVKENKVK